MIGELAWMSANSWPIHGSVRLIWSNFIGFHPVRCFLMYNSDAERISNSLSLSLNCRSHFALMEFSRVLRRALWNGNGAVMRIAACLHSPSELRMFNLVFKFFWIRLCFCNWSEFIIFLSFCSKSN